VEKLKSSKSIPEGKTVMTDDDVDHDLLDFMRLHINGNSHCEVQQTTGVLESAEEISDVSPQQSSPGAKTDYQNSLDVSISRDGCQAAAEKVLEFVE
jgi:hypothetical protein